MAGWTEPANLIALAGLVVVLIGALVGFRRRRATSRRAQAEQITAWVERRSDDKPVVSVRNQSDLEIYDVFISLTIGEMSGKRVKMRRDVNTQLITAHMIGPQRTVPFPVQLSGMSGIEPHILLVFRDNAGSTWVRQDGRLRQHKQSLDANLFGVGVLADVSAPVHEHVETALGAVDLGDAHVVPQQDYSIQTYTQAGGHQIRVGLVPDGLAVKLASRGEVSQDGTLRTTIDFDSAGRIIALTIHNVTDPRNKMTGFSILHLSLSDSIILFFQKGKPEELMKRISAGWPMPGDLSDHLGEVMVDKAGALVAARIVNVRHNLLPGFLSMPRED